MNSLDVTHMIGNETVFYYPEGKKETSVGPHRQTIQVADSWLIRDGCVRALYLHQHRFFSSCETLAGIERRVVARFWEQAIEKLPQIGSWFPRVELAGTLRQPLFQLRLRPSPPLFTTIRFIECNVPDFRKAPRHKGPDIARTGALRQAVHEAGADEGILTTPTGFLLEGLTTNILWWENDTLCTSPPSRRVLPGVTLQLIRWLAQEKNVPFAYRQRKTAELNDCEVWAVNALHGIRRAVDWERSPFRTAHHTDLDDWNRALERFSERIRPLRQTG